MEVEDLPLSGVKLLIPKRFTDSRGFFSETYNRDGLTAVGVTDTFVQDNHVRTTVAGTFRGLHFQRPPFAQAKLVRCSHGRILDVAVDIRRGSPTFGQHIAVELSGSNWHQLLVPVGFAHGYMTLEADTEVQYKVSQPYAPAHDAGIVWNDPALKIAWPTNLGAPILSPKDLVLPVLSQIETPFAWQP